MRAMFFALAGDSTMTSGLGIFLSRLGGLHAECQTIGWDPMDPRHLIETFGTLGIIAIIFAETGLLIGFFLPGDSLLFTAGVLTVPALARGYNLSLVALVIGTPIAAILGAQVGHYLGAKTGPRLLSQPRARFFRPEDLHRAEHHLHRYGEGQAGVLARVTPILRTV